MPRFLSLRLTLPLLVVCGRLAAQTVAIAPERASGLYAVGETIRWQVTVTEAEKLRDATFTIKSGGHASVASGALALADGRAVLATDAAQPGWFLLEVKGGNAEASAVQAHGGALVAPEKIAPSSARPADFDAFWTAKLAEIADAPFNAVVTPGASERTGVDWAAITFDGPRGTHVQGQLARPAAGAKFPALLVLQWAGVYGLQKAWATDRAAEGWLVLNTLAHDLAPFEPEAFYQALNAGALKDYPRLGNEDRETSYFLRMYLAAARAAAYLATRPDWDGRTLVATGGSQGGLQALVVAALDPRITAVVANVPAGGDQGGFDAGRVPAWPVWARQAWDRDAAKVMRTAAYFDVTHFAPRVRCPVLLSTGLIDTVVPPSSVYAVANQLGGPRRVFPMPLADHLKGHGAFYAVQAEWFAAAREGRALPVDVRP